jgi:ribosomal-protein-alanine N-acetyltransferase
MGLAIMMLVRPMETVDVGRVMGLETVAYTQPWTQGVFLDELAADNRVYLIAEHEGEIVGYGGLMVVGEDAHVTTLVSIKPAPLNAIGTRLMLALIDAGLGAGARQLTLEVRASNREAQEFYRKFGMAPVGLRKNYYLDEDALIMWAHEITEPDYADRLAKITEALP